MKRIFSVVWFAMRTTYDDLYTLVGMGLLWFVIAVLLPYGVFWLTATFLPILAVMIPAILVSLIPAPPITAALYHVASHLAREKRIEFGYFWEGFRSYFWRSWKVSGVLLVVGALLVFDVVFYLRSDNTLFSIIGFLGVWALAFWLAIQVYVFPLMVFQEDKSLKVILKNASLLTLAYPIFVLGILVAVALATALSAVLLILLPTLWMPFVAVISCRALATSLDTVELYRQKQAELEEEKKRES